MNSEEIQNIIFNATNSLLDNSTLEHTKTLYEDYKKDYEAFQLVSEHFDHNNSDIINKLTEVIGYHLFRLEYDLSFNLKQIQEMLIAIKGKKEYEESKLQEINN